MTTPQPLAHHLSIAQWNNQPAILSFDRGAVEVLVDGEHVAFIHINDGSLWATLVDEAAHNAVIFRQGEDTLWTTIDGGFELARLGVRLYRNGELVEVPI